MVKQITALAFIATLALAGCGDSDVERGVTGAAIGGVASSVVGGDAFTGALLGGAVGVMCDDFSPQHCN